MMAVLFLKTCVYPHLGPARIGEKREDCLSVSRRQKSTTTTTKVHGGAARKVRARLCGLLHSPTIGHALVRRVGLSALQHRINAAKVTRPRAASRFTGGRRIAIERTRMRRRPRRGSRLRRRFHRRTAVAVVQPSAQLGLALAHQVLCVDLVALRLGKRQVEVDRQSCPIDMVMCRCLVTGVVACRAIPEPTLQWAESLHGVSNRHITFPSHACAPPSSTRPNLE